MVIAFTLASECLSDFIYYFRVIQLDVKNVISVLCHMLENGHFQSKIAVLDWINHLLQKVPNKVSFSSITVNSVFIEWFLLIKYWTV